MSSNIPTFLRFDDAGTKLVKFAFDFITEADYMAYKTANGASVPVFVSNDAVWTGPTPWGLLIANATAQTIIQIPTPTQIAAGYVLAANGSWVAGGGGGGPAGPSGSNTQVQFNDSAVMNAVSTFTFDKSTGTLQVNGAFINSTFFTQTANNALNLGGVAAASYVTSSSLTTTLSSYATLAGLAANVAILSANNAAYLGGILASSYVQSSTLSAYETKAALSGDVSGLTANSANYLGSVLYSFYVTNSDSRTMSGNLFFTASNVAFGNSTAFASINSSGYFLNGTLYAPTPPGSYVQNTDSRTLSGNLFFSGANVFFSNAKVGVSTQFWTVNSTAIAINSNGAGSPYFQLNEVGGAFTVHGTGGFQAASNSTQWSVLYANGLWWTGAAQQTINSVGVFYGNTTANLVINSMSVQYTTVNNQTIQNIGGFTAQNTFGGVLSALVPDSLQFKYSNGVALSVANQSAFWVGNTTANTTQNATGFYVNGVQVSPSMANSVGFLAHKNGVDQNVTNATATKVTFTSTTFNNGNYYDAVNSRWTPPAGPVLVTFTVWGRDTGGTPVSLNAMIYKNGSVYKGNFITVSQEQGCEVTCVDNASGTDYYEAWTLINGGAGGTPAASGSTTWTHFSGTCLGTGIQVPVADGFNVVRNGLMDVWQRGTAVANSSTGTYFYGPDGFQVAYATAPSQVTRVASSGSRSKYAMRLTGNTSQTLATVRMLTEASMASRVVSRNVTFQAVITNNSGASITPQLTVNYASADDNFSSTVSVLAATNLQTIASGATGTVAYTYAVPAGAKTGLQHLLSFSGLNANTKTVDVTEVDVQGTPLLSVGLQSAPPVPQWLDVASEMDRSQRYLYPLAVGSIAGGASVLPYMTTLSTSTTIDTSIAFATPMRAVPTLVGTQPTWQASIPSTGNIVTFYQYGTGYEAITGSLTVSIANQSQAGVQLRYQASTSFAGTPGVCGASFIGPSVNLLASAELT